VSGLKAEPCRRCPQSGPVVSSPALGAMGAAWRVRDERRDTARVASASDGVCAPTTVLEPQHRLSWPPGRSTSAISATAFGSWHRSTNGLLRGLLNVVGDATDLAQHQGEAMTRSSVFVTGSGMTRGPGVP